MSVYISYTSIIIKRKNKKKMINLLKKKKNLQYEEYCEGYVIGSLYKVTREAL